MAGGFTIGRALDVDASLTEIVGISDGRLTTGALKLCPLVIDGASLTAIVGTACVVDTLLNRPRAGAEARVVEALTEITGTGGETPIDGILPLRAWPEEGVSVTEMIGIVDTDCGLLKRPRLAGRVSLTDILGMGGCGRDDGSAYGSAGTGFEDTSGSA